MSRLSGLIVCVVMAGLGGRASACLNDRESKSHETEFRSQYSRSMLADVPAEDHAPPDRQPIPHNYVIAGGMVLLMGSVLLASKRARPRN